MKTTDIKKGFSLVEVLLVVLLMATLFGLSLVYYNSTLIRTDLNTQVSEFVSYLRLAQSDAASGNNGDYHGVHLEQDQYVIFIGSSYDPFDTDNFEFEFPETIQIQNITLNGGGANIIFESPDGATDDYGTLNFALATGSESILITITKFGSINY